MRISLVEGIGQLAESLRTVRGKIKNFLPKRVGGFARDIHPVVVSHYRIGFFENGRGGRFPAVPVITASRIIRAIIDKIPQDYHGPGLFLFDFFDGALHCSASGEEILRVAH